MFGSAVQPWKNVLFCIQQKKGRMEALNVEMAPYYRGAERIRVTVAVLTQAPQD